ncbi:MAG: 8-oxoguanine DNA glycosylase [Firmicutes bacterium]|nr:8-oxoguanine DNA glycosylase [Bacillota bacterium]
MEYILNNVKDFNLDHIFDCGQCFRWEKQEDGSYIGPALGKVIKISTEGKEGDVKVTFDNCSEADYEELWKDYLDMERDYTSIKKILTDGDQVLAKAADFGYGIRILKQDFWETVVSFIISQNNNIPRIKGCIESICKSHGELLGEYGGREYFAIPTPEVMASLTIEDLEEAKLGYRARYLIETAKEMLKEGGPEAVKQRLVASANPIEELQAFTGIGPKVAACISLFGLARMDAFPIDVWMRRVMSQLYDIDEKDVKTMKAYAADHFGEHGGIAQQYLFYYIRG